MYKTQGEKNWANYEKLLELMGHKELLEELMQAMSTKECQENFEHIARMHDIEVEE